MSFSKTISVVAALGSIFSVGLASWKISEDIKNSQTAPLEEKINQLEEKLEKSQKPVEPVEQVVQTPIQPTPQTIIVPPVTPPAPPAPAETQE